MSALNKVKVLQHVCVQKLLSIPNAQCFTAAADLLLDDTNTTADSQQKCCESAVFQFYCMQMNLNCVQMFRFKNKPNLIEAS